MKRKTTEKAFTLIELLAVIVILAIIALIAVPVILNIIDKANKSAFKDSAYGVLNAAEYYYAASQLEIEGPMETVEMETTDPRLELKGSIPNGKVIITRDGKISLMVKNERYCVTKGFEAKDVTITEEPENCEIPSGEGNQGETGEKTLTDLMVSTTNNCVTSGQCTPEQISTDEGVKVTINVKENTPKDFYVIADDGNKVTLIMDRNIGSEVYWVSEDDYTVTDACTYSTCTDQGPITALNYLNSQINSKTETWSNIPAIESYEYINNANGTTNTYGYQKLTITNGTGVLTSQDGTITTTLTGTMRARLITNEEVSTLTTNNGTMPSWLYTNLFETGDDSTSGYWTSTSAPNYFLKASFVLYTGRIADRTTFSNSNAAYGDYGPMLGHGVRPVIELSK